MCSGECGSDCVQLMMMGCSVDVVTVDRLLTRRGNVQNSRISHQTSSVLVVEEVVTLRQTVKWICE